MKNLLNHFYATDNDVDIQSLYLRMERVYMVYTFELYMAALIFMREAC
jgi:hypothetical protein